MGEQGDRQRRLIEAADRLSPRVERIINASRVVELQLLISEAITLIEADRPEDALAVLDSARDDYVRRGPKGPRTVRIPETTEEETDLPVPVPKPRPADRP